MVGDRSRHWRAQVFQPSDAISRHGNGYTELAALQENEAVPQDATRVAGGWDHEHCKLCFATISVQPQHQHVGYIDEENPVEADWLCRDCYTKYIVPRLEESE